MSTPNPVEAATSTPAASTAPGRGPAGPAKATFDHAATPHPSGHQAGQVQATPRQDHPTHELSRDVNEQPRDQEPVGTNSKDASATPAARRVPAPLLTNQPALWAIAVLAGAAYLALTIWFLTKGPTQ